MKKVNLKLKEILFLNERINYLLSFELDGGIIYDIYKWSEPITEKVKYIINTKLKIEKDNINNKELIEEKLLSFFETEDIIECNYFKKEWIEGLKLKNITILLLFTE